MTIPQNINSYYPSIPPDPLSLGQPYRNTPWNFYEVPGPIPTMERPENWANWWIPEPKGYLEPGPNYPPAGYPNIPARANVTGNQFNGPAIINVGGTVNATQTMAPQPNYQDYYNQLAQQVSCGQQRVQQQYCEQPQVQQCVPVKQCEQVDPRQVNQLNGLKQENQKLIKEQDKKVKSIEKKAKKLQKGARKKDAKKLKKQIKTMKKDLSEARRNTNPDQNAPIGQQIDQYGYQNGILKKQNKALKKIDKKLKKQVKGQDRVKKYGWLVTGAAIGASLLTAGALAPVLGGGLLGAVGAGAAGGVVGGFINGTGKEYLRTKDFGKSLKQGGKGALYGGAIGAVTGGVMHYAAPVIGNAANGLATGIGGPSASFANAATASSYSMPTAIGSTLNGAANGVSAGLYAGPIIRGSDAGDFGEAFSNGFRPSNLGSDALWGAAGGGLVGIANPGVVNLSGGNINPLAYSNRGIAGFSSNSAFGQPSVYQSLSSTPGSDLLIKPSMSTSKSTT